MRSKTSDRPTIFTLLLTCGIRLNLMRLDAEKAGKKCNRNKVIFAYFRRFINHRDPDISRIARVIAKAENRAAYAYDQYFLLWIGFKPTPDAADLGPVIEKGLKQHGYDATI